MTLKRVGQLHTSLLQYTYSQPKICVYCICHDGSSLLTCTWTTCMWVYLTSIVLTLTSHSHLYSKACRPWGDTVCCRLSWSHMQSRCSSCDAIGGQEASGPARCSCWQRASCSHSRHSYCYQQSLVISQLPFAPEALPLQKYSEQDRTCRLYLFLSTYSKRHFNLYCIGHNPIAC